ncbi:hypothetical protein RR11_3394 [Ruegeria sp. R11]|jgi:hypothetical protein|nr:hypothetical protein RR11_3394 [Ruegeria sp. R11]
MTQGKSARAVAAKSVNATSDFRYRNHPCFALTVWFYIPFRTFGDGK